MPAIYFFDSFLVSYTHLLQSLPLTFNNSWWGEVAAVSFLAVIVAGAFWLAVSWPCDFGSRMLDEDAPSVLCFSGE